MDLTSAIEDVRRADESDARRKVTDQDAALAALGRAAVEERRAWRAYRHGETQGNFDAYEIAADNLDSAVAAYAKTME